MIIKKFQGKTENEATEAAKKELGNGVVVMNVKEVKKKGLISFLRPAVIEITVALEEEPDRILPNRKEKNVTVSQNDKKADDRVLAKKNTENKAIEEKLESLQSLIEKQLQLGETEKEAEEEDDVLEEKEADSNDRFLKLLYHTMMENEVNEKYANQIIDELDSVLKPNMPIDFILSNVYQKMILKFGQSEGISAPKKGPKIIFFIGPTGVGKTTTIAKIASRYKVEDDKKIALFTADTYRIAAAEQLRTYANILEVPFRVIYSPEDMKQGIEEFKSLDYIFVDTAGHSHKNEKQQEDMLGLMKAVDEELEKETYLVLSATTKYKDLLNIADVYHKLADYKLIFTKLDETIGLGNLLNLRLYTNVPIAYVTYGQNVPDDIEDFNPQKTVKTLLGGSRNS